MSEEKKPKAPAVSTRYAGPAYFGLAVIFLTFGVAGGWAAVAPLDSAVLAPGVVSVENNRRSVQHFEGGIISEIHVNDGQRVEEGDVLFRLDTTRARASENVERQQLHTAQILEARLLAERDNLNEVTLPEEIKRLSDDPVIAQAIEDQLSQFQERRISLNGQIQVLNARIRQTEDRIEGLDQELEATREQIRFIKEELVGIRQLFEKGLVPSSRLMSLERERARLQGVIGRTVAEISGARSTIGEIELQTVQLQREYQERAAERVTEVRNTINELKEKLTVTSDVLRRTAILAPRSGTVINLNVFTIGQVIRPADELLEIVPEDEGLVITAEVSPADIDRVAPGMRAEVRFSAFKVNETPVVYGTVREVSADRLINEDTRQPYFRTRVVIPDSDIPDEIYGRIVPGMAADMIFPTGERTVLQYVIHPIQQALAQSMKEE